MFVLDEGHYVHLEYPFKVVARFFGTPCNKLVIKLPNI